MFVIVSKLCGLWYALSGAIRGGFLFAIGFDVAKLGIKFLLCVLFCAFANFFCNFALIPLRSRWSTHRAVEHTKERFLLYPIPEIAKFHQCMLDNAV